MPVGIGYNRNSQSIAPSYGGSSASRGRSSQQPAGGRSASPQASGFGLYRTSGDNGQRDSRLDQARASASPIPAEDMMRMRFEQQEARQGWHYAVGPGGQWVKVPAGQTLSDMGLMDLYPDLTPEQAFYIQTMQDLQKSFEEGLGGNGSNLGGGSGLFFGGI